MRIISAHMIRPIIAVVVWGTLSAVPAWAVANPYDWFTTGSNRDPLNFEATGPQGDYWTVSNLLGGSGWTTQGIVMSDQYADVAYPGQYVIQDNKLAVGDVFCTSPGCRNHARLWGIPFSNSTDSIQTASTEHYVGGIGGGAHVVDSYNSGRDGVFWTLWPYQWVQSGGWAARYGAGCVPQSDGSCAPYDGQVAYQCISSSGYCSWTTGMAPALATAPSAAVTTLSSQQSAAGAHGSFAKPAVDHGRVVPIRPRSQAN